MTNRIGGEASIGRGPQPGPEPGYQELELLPDLVDILRAGLRVVVDLFDRIFFGIQWIAPVVLGLGCQSTNEPAVEPPPPEKVAPLDAATAETEPRQLGKFTITFYYVVGEEEVLAKARAMARAANDNSPGSMGDAEVSAEVSAQGGSAEVSADVGSEGGSAELAAIVPEEMVTLYDGSGGCQPIAEVTKEFATQLTLQGTGKLRDGRIVNIWGACNCERTPCFKVVKAQWGTAGTGRPLQPFRTIAVDPKVVKLGSLLYLPLLEGRTMPGRPPWGGFVHDGCVVADDTGGHILGKRIDLFVGRRAYYLGLSGSGGRHAWARNVPVFDGSSQCERKGRKVGRKSASI